MKSHLCRILLLASPLAASSFLASCVSNDYRGASHQYSDGTGYVTYDTLPRDYSGDAYYYDNRYYAGGRYEPGRYSYGGRTYDHRYFHDGQYLYGGDYRRQAAAASYRGSSARSSTSVGYVTYDTLPRDYSGDAYYYDNRYYAGGRYEPGRYTYGGRTYDHRYFHDGEYLYGGDYRRPVSTVQYQSNVRRRYSPVYRTTTQRMSY